MAYLIQNVCKSVSRNSKFSKSLLKFLQYSIDFHVNCSLGGGGGGRREALNNHQIDCFICHFFSEILHNGTDSTRLVLTGILMHGQSAERSTMASQGWQCPYSPEKRMKEGHGERASGVYTAQSLVKTICFNLTQMKINLQSLYRYRQNLPKLIKCFALFVILI